MDDNRALALSPDKDDGIVDHKSNAPVSPSIIVFKEERIFALCVAGLTLTLKIVKGIVSKNSNAGNTACFNHLRVVRSDCDRVAENQNLASRAP